MNRETGSPVPEEEASKIKFGKPRKLSENEKDSLARINNPDDPFKKALGEWERGEGPGSDDPED